MIFVKNGNMTRTFDIDTITNILIDEKLFLIKFEEMDAYLYIDEIYKQGSLIMKYSIYNIEKGNFSSGYIETVKNFAHKYKDHQFYIVSEDTKAKALLLRGE